MAQSPQRFRQKAANEMAALAKGDLFAGDGTEAVLARIADALERLAPPAPPQPDFTTAEAFVWQPEGTR